MELPFEPNNQYEPDDDVDDKQEASDDEVEEKVSLRERLKHLTWAWFTLPMSTGGLALLLNATPHRFPGLTTIGKVVYVFDVVIFLMVVFGIITRFCIAPGRFSRSLHHPTEALFFPTAWLALLDVLAGIQEYGAPSCGPWLNVAIRVLFWLYVAMTFIVAVWQYWFLFTAPQQLTVQSMTPAWILPIFPVMLAGTFASIIAADQPPEERMPIIIAGITFQGLGWMVAFLMFSVYLRRLMQYGLPAPNLRPGMFIAVGPPSFTALALIGISNALPQGYGYFATRPVSIEVLQTLATFGAVFLWALAFWFFCISAVSVAVGVRQMTFRLVWWAFVFPNTGFTIATINIGEQLDSEGILWLGSAMTILIVAMWLFVFVNHVRAVLRKEILMPGKDEDKDQYKEEDRKHHIPTPPSKVSLNKFLGDLRQKRSRVNLYATNV